MRAAGTGRAQTDRSAVQRTPDAVMLSPRRHERQSLRALALHAARRNSRCGRTTPAYSGEAPPGEPASTVDHIAAGSQVRGRHRSRARPKRSRHSVCVGLRVHCASHARVATPQTPTKAHLPDRRHPERLIVPCLQTPFRWVGGQHCVYRPVRLTHGSPR
jgi:hypothetical protein